MVKENHAIGIEHQESYKLLAVNQYIMVFLLVDNTMLRQSFQLVLRQCFVFLRPKQCYRFWRSTYNLDANMVLGGAKKISAHLVLLVQSHQEMMLPLEVNFGGGLLTNQAIFE